MGPSMPRDDNWHQTQAPCHSASEYCAPASIFDRRGCSWDRDCKNFQSFFLPANMPDKNPLHAAMLG